MKQVFAGVVFSALLSAQCVAADSVDHSAQASKHSVLASVEGTATGVSIASAVVAAPVVITGATLSSTAVASQELADSVHRHHQSKPLPVTTKVITRDPAPNQVVINQTIIEQR